MCGRPTSCTGYHSKIDDSSGLTAGAGVTTRGTKGTRVTVGVVRGNAWGDGRLMTVDRR
jgi:hypothetical protein